MNRLFADTLYFTALINPKDQWHPMAIEIEPLVESADLGWCPFLVVLSKFSHECTNKADVRIGKSVRAFVANSLSTTEIGHYPIW